jgi:hypothetical protein
LTYDAEQLQPTVHPKILRIAQPVAEVELDSLVAIAESGDHDRTRDALWQMLN